MMENTIFRERFAICSNEIMREGESVYSPCGRPMVVALAMEAPDLGSLIMCVYCDGGAWKCRPAPAEQRRQGKWEGGRWLNSQG